MSGGFSFPILPGMNFEIPAIPDLNISGEGWNGGNFGISTKKRNAARERKRWKKIHKKQGRQ